MKNNYNSIFQTCFMHVSVVTASARGATGEKVGKANTGSRLFPLLCVPRSFCPSRWHTKLCYIGKLEKRMDLSQKYLSCFLSLDTTGKGNWQHSLQTTIQMPTSLGHNLKPWFFTQETWHLATEIQSQRASCSRLHCHRWPILGSLLSFLGAK